MEGLGEDTGDLVRSAIEHSQIDSLYITDNQRKTKKSKQFGLKKSHRLEVLMRLTLFGSMLLLNNKEKKYVKITENNR